VDGTLGEIRQKFGGDLGDANLEQVFFHATGEIKPPPKLSP
jgi:hypothetical protein